MRNILKVILSLIFYILLVVVTVIGFIGFYILVNIIQEKLFIKGEYIFYLIKSPYSYLLFVILTIVLIGGIMLLLKKEKLYCKNKTFSFWVKVDLFLILIIGLLTYVTVTSTVVITEDGIYNYSFFNLKGDKYSFSDVEYVNTGFIDAGRNKGSFFYNIKLKNGVKLKLAHPSMTKPSNKYDNDTWQEYVDIDKYIMNSGAKKESSENGSKYVSMDKVYIDKLLSVIRNK